jgi:hypothetical protein
MPPAAAAGACYTGGRNRARSSLQDPKQFVRQWNREIEAEAPRAAPEASGWKLVLWVAAELLWCAVLVAMVVWLKRLAW